MSLNVIYLFLTIYLVKNKEIEKLNGKISKLEFEKKVLEFSIEELLAKIARLNREKADLTNLARLANFIS